MFCPTCGKKNGENVKQCVFCGSELVDNQPETAKSPNNISKEALVNGVKTFPTSQKLLCRRENSCLRK